MVFLASISGRVGCFFFSSFLFLLCCVRYYFELDPGLNAMAERRNINVSNTNSYKALYAAQPSETEGCCVWHQLESLGAVPYNIHMQMGRGLGAV